MRTRCSSILFCIILLAWAAGCSSLPREEVFLKAGNKCYVTGDSDGAIENFTKTIDINPNCTEAYKNRGFARNDKAAFDGAISDWTKAIRLNPALGEYLNPFLAGAYKRRGKARYDKSDFDGAISDCTNAIKIGPKDAEAYFLRARVYARLGRRLDAYRDMGGARKHGQGYEEKFRKDKLLSGLWNTWKKAVNLGEKKESGQKDAKSCYSEGLKYFDKGKHKEAITLLDRAEELGCKEKDLFFKRGDSFNMTKAFDKAVKDFTRYISLAPKDPKGYFYRGTSYLFTWMPEESIRDYRKAISLDDKRPEYRFGLAAAHACAMNRDLMFENLRAAISKAKVFAERTKRVEFFRLYYDDEEFKKLTK